MVARSWVKECRDKRSNKDWSQKQLIEDGERSVVYKVQVVEPAEAQLSINKIMIKH